LADYFLIVLHSFFFPVAQQTNLALDASLSTYVEHTINTHTPGGTPLCEWSAPCGSRYQHKTLYTQQRTTTAFPAIERTL